jgi:23S rRNA (adenine2503-C2)-methyltransferase
MKPDEITRDTPEQAISGLMPERIYTELALDKPFRARQIFKWIADGARSFDAMTNLPLAERSRLERRARLGEGPRIFSTVVSKTLTDPDGTVKLQISLADGYAVETVLLTDAAGRKTACVSCQVGCPMNCAFCQTGHVGYARNLDAGEIVEQFYHLEDSVGQLDNIVFMGMGEPMLNLPAIREAVAILCHPEGRALSKRRITLSTSGVIDGIRSLADEGPDIRLAVSLTTANPDLRAELMPVTKANPLPALRKAIAYFSEKSGKRVTLEAALMGGVNTDERSAREIADFAQGLNVHVNLIPWNPVDTLPFKTPSQTETRAFLKKLETFGVNATLRTRRGEKIGGACGQLGRGTCGHMDGSRDADDNADTDDDDDFIAY